MGARRERDERVRQRHGEQPAPGARQRVGHIVALLRRRARRHRLCRLAQLLLRRLRSVRHGGRDGDGDGDGGCEGVVRSGRGRMDQAVPRSGLISNVDENTTMFERFSRMEKEAKMVDGTGSEQIGMEQRRRYDAAPASS